MTSSCSDNAKGDSEKAKYFGKLTMHPSCRFFCEGKQMLNRTLEIGHGVVGCTQSQGPELDEDLS